MVPEKSALAQGSRSSPQNFFAAVEPTARQGLMRGRSL